LSIPVSRLCGPDFGRKTRGPSDPAAVREMVWRKLVWKIFLGLGKCRGAGGVWHTGNKAKKGKSQY
jgi:hypothetical protein